jgi:Tfp pilus assembly protein PilX
MRTLHNPWRAVVGRAGGEDGFALVTAILTLSVVTMIGAAVVTLSSHSSRSSAYDRNRLLAVNAAEAGVDDYFATALTAPDADCSAAHVDLPSSPPSHYERTVVLYSAWPPTDGSVINSCPPTVAPLGALVTSTGTAVASSSIPATRTMESLVKLAPYYGSYNQAIFSDTGINLVNKLTANGYQGNDADIYTNGDFVDTNNITVNGSILAHGSITISNQTTVREDVWAKYAVDLSGSSTVFGTARSSKSSVTVTNPAHVYGSARAGTTIGGSGTIDGNQISNSPGAAPPALTLPHITFNPTDWTSQGYTIVTFSLCSVAQAYINALPPGNWVVRITPQCALSWANNSDFNILGNVAIITDGSVTFQNRSTITSVGNKYNLYFIRPWVSGLSCAGGNNDVSFSNNTNFVNLNLAVYSQCTVNMANQNGQSGQIFAGTVNVTNQMEFNYVPILFPGENQVGYNVFISYIREVTNP